MGSKKKFGVVLHLLCIFVLIQVFQIECSLTREKYGARLLNISPTACKSARFPNLTGTCMISLECQQRSGTVIGACRDGVLFGACCHDALEENTFPPVAPEVATDLPAELLENVGNVDAKQSNENARNEILETTLSVQETKPTVTEATSEDIPTERAFVSDVPNEIHDATESVTEVSASTSSSSIPTSHAPTTEFQKHTESQTTVPSIAPSTTSEKSTETTAAELLKFESVQTTSSNPVTTSTASTTPTPAITKTSGRINFSPKPFKPRVTTVKTIWTRPPTTEVSYVVFKASEEDDEEGETYSRPSRTSPATESTSNAVGSGSVEKTTTPQRSVEQTTIITSTGSTQETEVTTTTTTTTELPVQRINETETTATAVPVSTPSEPSAINATDSSLFTNVSTNETGDEGRSSSLMKKSRLSNENDIDSEDDSQDSSSSSLDHKLDDFVNQVVEGIAVELDKSNIDEVVFKSSTTTTTQKPTTSRPKSTTPKSKSHHSKKTKGKESSKGKAGASAKGKGSSKGNKAASVKAKGSAKEPIKRVTSSKKEDTQENVVKHAKSKKKPTKKVVTSKISGSNGTSVVLDYRKDCGVRPFFRQGRIVGGTPSVHGSWPWHALVKETVWWGLFSKIKCGGVLIGSRHVLTAAHCQPQPTGKLSVVLGVTDSDNPSSNSVTKAVRRIIKHPQFNPRSYENDIAILELESPVEFHPHIVPICLPELSETFEGKKGHVTGMGLLKHDGERPLVLHEVDVPIVNNSECQSMFRRSGNSKPIKSSFICAGYPQGLKDSCGGDSGSYTISEESSEENDFTVMNETDFFSPSGGPLSVQRENGQWVLAGTVSHGIKCAVPNQPGVYMRTTWFQPWIEKVTRAGRGRAAPKCHGPPGSCDHRGRSGGFLDTLFRVLRLARKMWQPRQ